MSVGIFMPAYNVGKYISQSINSVLKQSFIDWELIIIDDYSNDNTLEIAKSFKSDKIKVFQELKHSGKIGFLKNKCISKFTKNHEYICHVGSDDYIPTNCLEIFTNYMDKYPEIGVCYGNFLCFNDEGKQWAFPHVANSGEYNSSVLLQYMCLFPHRFYRKSVVDKVGGYSNELTSAVDYDLALKIDEITKIHRIKEPITYYYRQHAEQVSTKARKQQDLNAKIALESALKRRNLNGMVKNNMPPFIIEMKTEEHFIWGKK